MGSTPRQPFLCSYVSPLPKKKNIKIAHTVDAAKINGLSSHQNPPKINKVLEISKNL